MSSLDHDPVVPLPQSGDALDNHMIVGRRQFLHGAGGLLAAASLARLGSAQAPQTTSPPREAYVSLSPIQDVATEDREKTPGPFEGPDQRIGFAMVGIYAQTFRPQSDPRFSEVEATCNFTLRFPSRLLASCNSGYAVHRSLRSHGRG
jgi:hypothetical protein